MNRRQSSRSRRGAAYPPPHVIRRTRERHPFAAESARRYCPTWEPGRPIVFIHGAVNGDTHAFAEELAELDARHGALTVHARYSEPRPADRVHGRHDSEGLIEAELLEQLVGDAEAEYFVCGPKPMLAQVSRALQDKAVPDARVHYEFFGPKDG